MKSFKSILSILGKILLIFVFFVPIVLVFIVPIISGQIGSGLRIEQFLSQHKIQVFFRIISMLGMIAAPLIVYAIFDKKKNLYLGWKQEKRWILAFEGSLWGAIFIIITYLLLLIFRAVKIVDISLSKDVILSLGYPIIIYMMVAVSEEYLSRGYLHSLIKRDFGVTLAIIINSIIFALLHIGNPNIYQSPIPLLNLFLAGVLLAVAREVTGGLWVPIGIHFTWNLFQSLLGVSVSGTSIGNSVVKTEIVGHHLLSGGGFGIEGSAITTIVMLLFIIAIWKWYSKRSVENKDQANIEDEGLLIKLQKRNKAFRNGFIALAVLAVILNISYEVEISKRAITRVGVSECSVNIQEWVELGGVQQYLEIRGSCLEKPILLYLHGGPGRVQSPYAYMFQKKLEENFVVVNWDQRGAGKSYSEDIPVGTMNLKQFELDTIELVELLLDRYERERIYLMGHSSGAAFGIKVVQQHPEKFFAYIGIGQMVNTEEGEIISYEFALEEAYKNQEKEAIEELERIGYPPYDNVDDMNIHRKWLSIYDGSAERGSSIELVRSHSNIVQFNQYIAGLEFSIEHLLPELMKFNLLDDVIELKLPVYFIMGRHDYRTPTKLVEDYFDLLTAPTKELIIFEKDGHAPNFENADEFGDVLIRILDETFNGSI